VIEDKVIVELKAVTGRLKRVHIAQTVSERQVSGLAVALLVNFGDTSVQVRRLEVPD
jgi:GxxExxY protein